MGRQRSILAAAAISIVCALAWLAAARGADTEAPNPRALEVYELKNLDAKMVAENLNRLLQHRKDIKVTAGPKENLLLLLAAEADHETLRAFRTLVDPPVEHGGTDARAIPPGRAHVPTGRASRKRSEEEIAKMSDSQLRKFVSDLQERVVRLERNTSPRIMPLAEDPKLEK
jgi:hypothetical protein